MSIALNRHLQRRENLKDIDQSAPVQLASIFPCLPLVYWHIRWCACASLLDNHILLFVLFFCFLFFVPPLWLLEE
ncbi:hypothetical protein BKA57DRAFT_305306 [Linnemannia elongata]|nr:hypothetical protein BKA57DRAFT_305306 [Linnemannia elongata]